MRVLSSLAIKEAYLELVPAFQAKTGHKVDTEWLGMVDILKRVKAGESADDAGFSSYKLSETLQGDPRANPFIEAGDIITVPEANLVYVVGNVYTPLTIPLKEPITLSRAVAMAGGVKQDSKKDKVRIVRQEPGAATSREIVVDLTAIEKKRADDIALMPNDIIDVPTSGSKTFLRSLIGTVAPSLSQLPVRVIP